MDFRLNELQELLADSVAKFIDNEYDFETRQKIAGNSELSEQMWQDFSSSAGPRCHLPRRTAGWTAAPSN